MDSAYNHIPSANQSSSNPLAAGNWSLKRAGFLSANFLPRTFEFLCLGGASLLVMAFCFCLGNISFIMRDDVRFLLAQCAAFGVFLTALLSYPHTMWSYRFAYAQGPKFILAHSWPLVGYPFLIIGLLTLSVYSWHWPVATISGIVAFEKLCSHFGMALNWSQYESLGELLFAGMLILQIFMAGHHYIMQAYGIAIASGDKYGYFLRAEQKHFLRLNLYALWLVNLLSGYTFLSLLDSRGFGYHPMRFPWYLQAVVSSVFALTIILISYKIVWPIYKKTRRLPPLAAGVSILSVWLWLQPFAQPYGFQIGVVPLAHGLQYLYFAGQSEHSGFDPHMSKVCGKAAWRRSAWVVATFVVLACLGFIAYRQLPMVLDTAAIVRDIKPNFFFLAAYIFLSTHHYMIDSVVWRAGSRLSLRH